MPLTVVFEWVGGTFFKTLPMRLAYLSLFLALYWLADLTPAPPFSLPSRTGPRSEPRASPLGRARRPFGIALLGLGATALGSSFWWLLGPRYGLPRFEAPLWLANEPSRLLLPLLAAWPLALGSSLVREPRITARSYEQLGSFVALGFLLHLAAEVRVQALPVLAQLPVTPWLLLAVSLVLWVLALVPRGSFELRLGAVLAAGFTLRVLGIAAWQVDPRVRDMLALVLSAQDRFAAGHNPYAFYAMQHGSELPLTYFPGLWLGYGLPRAFGLDLRFMGAVAEVFLLLALAWAARRAEGERRAWAEAFVGCFAAVWLFSPSVQWNAIYAEPTLWWGLLGLLLALAFSRHYTAAALVLGYAVATRHFALVITPFVLLYFVRARGLRAALPYCALAGSVALLLLAPFVLADPEQFWFGTFRWLREYGPAHITWFFDRFGFMQQFHERGLLPQLPLAQWGAVLACFVGALLSRKLARIPSYAATALLLFIMLNVLLWDSFLLDGAVAAAAVVVTRPGAALSPNEAAKAPSQRVLRLSYVALALLALSGAYLAFTLVRTLHPPGRERAHDFMVAAVRPGDFVIDRSDRRVAFVEGSWLLRREEVPAPIGGALYDGAWGGGSALRAPGRVWLVTQDSRDVALRSAFEKLGKPALARSLGAYRVQAIKPHRAELSSPLSLPPGAGPQRCQVGWTDANLLGVRVSAQAPSVLSFARPTAEPTASSERVLLALGFPNQDVVWPRQSVEVRLLDDAQAPPFELQNLLGVQWTVWDGGSAQGSLPGQNTAAPLRIELTTTDPVARLVCLELVWLR